MVAQTFSRHDFAFRPAFCEFEGARAPVMWSVSQDIDAYEELAGLLHGEKVTLEGADDEELGCLDEALSEDVDADADTEDDGENKACRIGHISKAGTNSDVHLRPEVIVPTAIPASYVSL